MHKQRDVLILALIGFVASSGAAFAQAVGAYVPSGTKCDEVFAKSKGGLRFVKNVDAFSSAFIVRGKTLTTPLATCKLRRSAMKGDVRELDFECASSISFAPVTVYLRRAQDGGVIRQASTDDIIGTRYERCSE